MDYIIANMTDTHDLEYKLMQVSLSSSLTLAMDILRPDFCCISILNDMVECTYRAKGTK